MEFYGKVEASSVFRLACLFADSSIDLESQMYGNHKVWVDYKSQEQLHDKKLFLVNT